MGDFNLHVDDPSDTEAKKFCDMLDSLGLEQNVKHPTHIQGHTLDLVITRCCDSLLKDTPSVDHLFSDYLAVLYHINVPRTHIATEKISYRKIKSVDIDVMSSDIAASKLYNSTITDLNELATLYNSTLAAILDVHAPLKEKVMVSRHRVPWYSDEIKQSRKGMEKN